LDENNNKNAFFIGDFGCYEAAGIEQGL